MRSAGFIVAAEPYLLRAGMVSLIRKLDGVRVIREFGKVNPFISFTKKNAGYFVAITHSFFNRAGELYMTHPELMERTLLIADAPPAQQGPHVQAFILPDAEEDEITSKIQVLIKPSRFDEREFPGDILTQRERTIVRLVSLGMTNRQIADQLYLSTHTVITHRKNINSKLGIKSVSGLTVYAIVNNIITIEEVTSKT
jgi:DNA-binding CsgD family transcriptional regulator